MSGPRIAWSRKANDVLLGYDIVVDDESPTGEPIGRAIPRYRAGTEQQCMSDGTLYEIVDADAPVDRYEQHGWVEETSDTETANGLRRFRYVEPTDGDKPGPFPLRGTTFGQQVHPSRWGYSGGET